MIIGTDSKSIWVVIDLVSFVVNDLLKAIRGHKRRLVFFIHNHPHSFVSAQAEPLLCNLALEIRQTRSYISACLANSYKHHATENADQADDSYAH